MLKEIKEARVLNKIKEVILARFMLEILSKHKLIIELWANLLNAKLNLSTSFYFILLQKYATMLHNMLYEIENYIEHINFCAILEEITDRE